MLFSQINSILNDHKSVASNVASGGSQARPPSRISSAARKDTNAKSWTKDEVISWLTTIELQSLANVFKGYTGKTLKSLYEMKHKDYPQFCITIEKEIEETKVKIQTFEKLNFYEALDELFD